MFSVFFIFFEKSFEKGVDICVVMVYNVFTKLRKEVIKNGMDEQKAERRF